MFDKVKYFFGLEGQDEEEVTTSRVVETEQSYQPTPSATTQRTTKTHKTRPTYAESDYRREYQKPHHVYQEVIEPVESKKMVICKYAPVVYGEARSMIDDIKTGYPVIINFENTKEEVSEKIVYVCEGASYALGAEIQKIANSTFIIIPRGVNFHIAPEEDKSEIEE